MDYDAKIDEILEDYQMDMTDEADQEIDELGRELKQSGTAQDISQVGYRLQSNGYLEDADTIYEIGQKKFPNDDRWALLRGGVCSDDGRYEDALDYFLQINEDSDYYVDALLQEADVYQAAGLSNVALNKLQEARKIEPDQPIILYGIAELRYDQGDFEQAIPIYRELLDSNEFSDDLENTIREHYEQALALSGKVDESAQDLEDIPEDEMTDEDKERLAMYYVQMHDYDKARPLYQDLYENGKLSDDSLALYSEVKWHDKDYDQALNLITQAVNNDPYNTHYYQIRARYNYFLQREDDARTDLEQLLAFDEDNVEAAIMLAHIYLDMGENEKALELIEQRDDENSEDGSFLWIAAQTYAANEEYDDARRSYDRAYTLLDDNDFYKDYLEFQREEGNWKKINTVFTEHPDLQEDPDLQTLVYEWQDWKAQQVSGEEY